MIITIDGPAGTGKTTIAKQIAEKLGYHYFDTGAMYRAVTYGMIQKEIELEDRGSLETFLKEFQFDIRMVKGKKLYFMEDKDVTEVIRTTQVTQKVSEVSAHTAVRQALLPIQQAFGKGKNSVFEGRDMGTVVFPNAHVKFFLTARPAVRAERRYLELKEDIQERTSEEEVMHALLERDHFDSTREIAPLKQAEGAHLIDTSDLTVEQVIDRILALIPSRSS